MIFIKVQHQEIHTHVQRNRKYISSIKCYRPDPRYFIGSGKAQELAVKIHETDTRLVLFNCNMSPSQEHNLEQVFKSGYWDTVVSSWIYFPAVRGHTKVSCRWNLLSLLLDGVWGSFSFFSYINSRIFFFIIFIRC